MLKVSTVRRSVAIRGVGECPGLAAMIPLGQSQGNALWSQWHPMILDRGASGIIGR